MEFIKILDTSGMINYINNDEIELIKSLPEESHYMIITKSNTIIYTKSLEELRFHNGLRHLKDFS